MFHFNADVGRWRESFRAFLAVDLFLFYFAWELMLIPVYFLIVIWGHERRVYAALKFSLFTQLQRPADRCSRSCALYFLHHQTTGVYTFEYSDLLRHAVESR